MTPRNKSVLMLGGTLLAGVLIGALAVGAIVNHRVDQLQALRRPGGFGHALEEVIRPTDDAQRREIRAVMARAAEENAELRRYVRERHFAILDSVRTEMRDILTPEQQERLQQWMREQRPGRASRRGHRRR